jgi:argininosuccinate lyase
VISSRLDQGYLDATTLMEYLIQRGIPQRTAHERIGQLVAKAMKQNIPLGQLPLSDFQEIVPSLDEHVYEVLGVEQAVAAFVSEGSTNPDLVERQLHSWRSRLGEKCR